MFTHKWYSPSQMTAENNLFNDKRYSSEINEFSSLFLNYGPWKYLVLSTALTILLCSKVHKCPATLL